MRIISLNVNNFGGLSDAKPKPGNYEETKYFQNSPQRIATAEEIVSTLVIKAPDIIVLQEFDVNAPAGRTTIKRFCECGYQPIYPDRENRIDGNSSITIMFVKSELSVERDHSPVRKAWKWCGVRIGEFIIVGLHIPDSQQFLDEIKTYAGKFMNEKLIILGDFNIATNERRVKKHAEELETAKQRGDLKKVRECKEFFERKAWFDHMVSAKGAGYSDAIAGDPITYFPGQTTVDHVLVSPALKDRVITEVIAQDVLELSDHAVVTVDIKA